MLLSKHFRACLLFPLLFLFFLISIEQMDMKNDGANADRQMDGRIECRRQVRLLDAVAPYRNRPLNY